MQRDSVVETGNQVTVEIVNPDLIGQIQVLNGDRILWVNKLGQDCTVVFDASNCPFVQGSNAYTMLSSQQALSEVVQGTVGVHYPFSIQIGRRVPGRKRGTPEVIING